MGVLTRSSAFDVREQSGPSLKSSLKHILSVDLRDELIFPSCGTLLQLTTEVAGLGGDVGFFRNDLYLQHNYSILDEIVSILCLCEENFNKVLIDIVASNCMLHTRDF